MLPEEIDRDQGRTMKSNPAQGSGEPQSRATCGAKTRDGDPCRNPPMSGATRCRMHGGATPRGRAAAERRLAEAEAARHVTAFGARTDITAPEALLELVQSLGEMAAPYGAWVRLHYVYPYPSVDEIIPLMAQGLVLPYLDVPFQHSHPDVLKRMKRPASGEKNLDRIQRWREACPELVIRSTFIAGFPGETEEEFQHLPGLEREAHIHL